MTAPRGPDLDLQIGIATLLGASANLKLLCGNPVRLEVGPLKPYITIGEGGAQNASVENFNPVDISVDLHIWSKEATFAEAKQIAAAIYAALHEKQGSLTLTEYNCTALIFERQTNMRDPDGGTKHIAISFAAHLAPKP